jgi:hypothetical protein
MRGLMEDPVPDATPNAPISDGNDTSGDTSAAGSEFQAITSQEDLNKVISDRVKRERAKFADYADLKTRAARLDEIEQASKSDFEKATERITSAEQRAQAAEQQLARFRVANSKGIPDWADFLTGSDESEMEAAADLILSRINAATSPRQPRPDPNQGRGDTALALNSDGLEEALRSKLGI